MSDPRLLIDADMILYKSVAASEFEGHWGDGIIVASTNMEQAKDMFQNQIDSIQKALGSQDTVFVISGSNNFRYALTPDYKSNRKGNRKPLGYVWLLEWMKEQFPDRVVSNDILEADDYMGILATRPNAPPSIIVSDDKDMKTIPGKLFRLGELSTIDEDEAERYWWLQTLTGDATDGYKGCPGVGEVKAQKVLSKPGSRWENVRSEFLKAGMTEDYAVLQARLARILRFADWNTTTKQPKLWSPPTR